jgi:uncharacterized protein YdhG (YjbR/CyaY superfamily)
VNTVDEYIANFPIEIQEKLKIMREIILEAAPNATEKISYQMPTFVLNGNLVYFGAFKKHIGFFPMPSGIEAFKDELLEYKLSKGTIQLPFNKPIPIELIQRIVQYRVEENSSKSKE